MREIKLLVAVAALFTLNATPVFGGWTIMTADDYEDDTGYAPCLELDSMGNPHIVYCRSHSSGDLSYAYYNFYSAHPTWQITTIEESTHRAVSFTLDDDDKPHIAYVDDDWDLKYIYQDGSEWVISTIDHSVYYYGTSIAVDSKGNPHISYHGYCPCDLRYAYWSGSTWVISAVDGSTGNTGHNSSIELTSNDYPRIAYKDGTYHDLKYAAWNGSTWYIYTVDDYVTSGYTLSNIIDLELDSFDRPHIAYRGSHIQWYPPFSLKYAYWTSRFWTIETVDDSGDQMKVMSLALDSNNDPHVSYVDYVYLASDLKYAYKNGSSWSISVLVDDEVWATGTSIEVDSEDNPNIAFNINPSDYNGHLGYAYYVPKGGKTTGYTQTSPSVFSLGPATPNPMTDAAAITFALPHACEVDLSLFDIKGRKVQTLAEGQFGPGEHAVEISGLSSGLYIYKLETDEFSDTGKIVAK